MKITPELTDSAVLAELGVRVAHRRVTLGRTQADVAREAGISKRTLERLEAGEAAQTTTLVRVLRQLDALDAFESLLPPAVPGPVDALRRAGELPKRARRPGKAGRGGPWRWDDDP